MRLEKGGEEMNFDRQEDKNGSNEGVTPPPLPLPRTTTSNNSPLALGVYISPPPNIMSISAITKFN